MSHRLHFFAEQAFFGFVKESISNPIDDHEKSVERGAVCVVALACGLEGVVNTLLKNHTNLRHWDDLRLRSKVETLLDFANLEIDCKSSPLQNVLELITIRNWLVHFKDSNIGLMNSQGMWIKDVSNKLPKRNPDKELTMKNVEKLYRSVIEYCKAVCIGMGVAAHFDYLESEDYEAFLLL